MRTLRQINIKNRPHYFFNDIINIKNVDPDLLAKDKISFKSTNAVIYHCKSIDHVNIYSANSPYLIFNNVDGYIECNSTKESNEDKYLIFPSTDRNKEVLEPYTELWDEIKNQTGTINGGKPIEYRRDFMKIRFE